MAKVPGTYNPKTKVWEGEIPGSHEPGFVEQPLVEVETPEEIKAMHFAHGSRYLAVFEMGDAHIILGHEPEGPGKQLRWHLTISCPDRHPTWDEIKTARYRLGGPDMVMAMVLPRPEDYVNIDAQDHVFQLWQLVDDEAEGW